nr:MAG TPA: hypothetical protein [Caudoviricetes sp.]
MPPGRDRNRTRCNRRKSNPANRPNSASWRGRGRSGPESHRRQADRAPSPSPQSTRKRVLPVCGRRRPYSPDAERNGVSFQHLRFRFADFSLRKQRSGKNEIFRVPENQTALLREERFF